MSIQTSFAKKLTLFQDCDHRFLALLGNDGELDLALLDVKNRVRDLSLRKYNILGSNEALTLFLTKASPIFSQGCPSPRRRQGEAEGL